MEINQENGVFPSLFSFLSLFSLLLLPQAMSLPILESDLSSLTLSLLFLLFLSYASSLLFDDFTKVVVLFPIFFQF